MITANILTAENRIDTWIELITVGTASIVPEQGLVVSPPPPKSLALLDSVEVSPCCSSVHTYKGITYAACSGGVDRIDENNKATKSFISGLSGNVQSVLVHNDKICSLSSDSTVRVHDLEGESITSWIHADKSKWVNQFAIICNQIAIPNRPNKTLVFYSLSGEVVNTLSCPLLADAPVRMSAADNSSIIISQCDSSLVYKVDTSSGNIIWQCKDVVKPQGVTCCKDEFVLVANDGSLSVLSLHAGWLLCRIHV